MIKRIAEQIPIWLEMTIVMMLCFGLPTLVSIYDFLSGRAFERVEISDNRIVALLIYESVVSAITVGFLYLRGYRIWQQLRFGTSIKGIAIGAGSVVAVVMAYASLWILVNLLVISLFHSKIAVATYSITVSLPFVLVLSLINPLFEEAFLLGYMLDRLCGASVWVFIGVTTIIRISYHLYQGWVGILALLPTGVIMAFVYWKTRNLMPVFFAHALMDMTGLLWSH